MLEKVQGSHFSIVIKFHVISTFFFFFFFFFANFQVKLSFFGAKTPFGSFISLVGGGSDLKSTELWFNSFERNFSRPPIHWLRSNALFPQSESD